MDKSELLAKCHAGFLRIWGTYKPQEPTLQRLKVAADSSIDDAIDAVVNAELASVDAVTNKYENWRKYKPRWTREYYFSDTAESAIAYWLRLRVAYPNLAQLAIDVLTIPASSCDCERMFSELGDLLKPKRRKMSSHLLAALQSLRSWIRAGFSPPTGAETAAFTDDEMDSEYALRDWESDTY